MVSLHLYYYCAGNFTPPTVNMPQTRVKLKVNNYHLSLRCTHYKNNFYYLWEKKDSDLTYRAQGVYSSKLTIFNLRPEDSGEYRCIMSNATGRIASSYSKLIVTSMYIMYIYLCKHV